MSDFSFKKVVNSQYNDRVKATAPIKEVDAYIFCTSSKYLGERLFPFQSLLIKVMYGLWKKYPISEDEQKIVDILNNVWHIDLKLAERDPQKFIEILILVLGRRSGKSSLVSFIQTYEAYKLICKGDPQAYYNIRRRHPIWIVNTAKDGAQAQDPFRLCKDNIRRISFFEKYVDWSKDNSEELRLFTPADLYENAQIRKYNESRPKNASKKNLLEGSVMIAAFTTSAASKRGKSIICLILDEFAHFERTKTIGGGATEEDILAEMPQTDYAMLKALSPSTKDFIMADRGIFDGKVIMISSPREKGGEFYRNYCFAGGSEQTGAIAEETNNNYLLVQLATWECNPKYPKKVFDSDFKKDPIGANMEYGAHFGEPSTSFIDALKIDEMVKEHIQMEYVGLWQRQYIISVDPASKSDTYAVTWGHVENDIVIIDGVQGFRPKVVHNKVTGKIINLPVKVGEVVKFIKALAARLCHQGILLEIVFDQWNCLPASTVLYTENGMKTIKELVDIDKSIKVASKDGIATATKFYDNGVRPVKKITTKFGYALTGTDNHPVWTPRGWVNIAELGIGDKIAIKPGRIFGAADTISSEQAAIYGYLSGDGNCTGKNPYSAIEFINIDPDIQKEFATYVERVFEISTQKDLRNKEFYTMHESKHYGTVVADTVRFTSKKVSTQLCTDGVCGNAFTKRAPKPVREGSADIVSSYLSAIFECDGNIEKYSQKTAQYRQIDTCIEYNTRSKTLAADMHLLLLNFGIITSCIEHEQVDKPYYRIMIRGENIEKFSKYIGFRSTRKKQQLQEVLNHRIQLDQFRCKQYLDDNDIYWDTIISIENTGKERVYDITVPGPHSFVANGIATHNSQESITTLKNAGHVALETFFSNKYKNEMYTNFLEKLNSGQVHCFSQPPAFTFDGAPSYMEGWLEQLKLELKYLTKTVKGDTVKYGHPNSGPIQTDDFADVVANLVHRHGLYQSGDRQVYKDLYKQTGRPVKHQTGNRAGKRVPGMFQNRGKGATTSDILRKLNGRIGNR